MSPEELRRLSRPELIERAEALGIPRPKTLTTGELVDEILTRTAPPGTARRGWLGKARDLVAAVVERGLHLPEAARVLRATQRRAPAPPPPLPTVTLAEIYAAQGYFGKAVTVLNEVLRREPEHEEASTLRARFAGRMSEAEREELGVDASGAELPSDEAETDETAAADEAAGTVEATAADETTAADEAKARDDAAVDDMPATPDTEEVAAVAESESAETARAETARAESAETARAESAETARAESAETARAESARAESARAESARAETARAETAPAETARAETARAETARAETARAETARAESAETAPASEVSDVVVIEAEAPAAAVKVKASDERPVGARPAEKKVAPPDTIETPPKAAPVPQTPAPKAENPEGKAKDVPPPAPSSSESMVVEVQAEAELESRETVPPTTPAGTAVAEESDDDGLYDLDDVVGLAVDSHTVYAYWEVRPTTFAKARWSAPDARLVVRVLVAGGGLTAHGGREVETRDIAVDELVGDTFIRGLPGAAEIRLCVGMLSDAGFTPIAVAPELSTPRSLRDEPAAAPSVLPAAMAQTFSPMPSAEATHPEGAALAMQQWAMFSRSRSGELTTVDFGMAQPSGPQRVLVRRTLHSEMVRGGASDLVRRDLAAEEWALRWGPGGASDMVRGRGSDLSRGHASDLSRRL